ncbi:hypothetical protein PVA46_00280 [Entomospira culicis]|nr:hypothetical protein [Entomospira culicis]WDI37261.1 hypothetical protein PVA46_00280 [Entomospira culicis]
MLYRSWLYVRYRQWRFHHQAIRIGMKSEPRRLLWQLVRDYHIKESAYTLMNSRLLNKILLKALNDVEMDLSISLKERELLQYQYYEIKRFFDRVKVSPSLLTTKDLPMDALLLINKPDNVRLSLRARCIQLTNLGFSVALEKMSQEQWATLSHRGIFEFLYTDAQHFEYHFTAKLRTVKEDSGQLSLFFAHSKSIEILADQRPPSRRFDREALLAPADLLLDKTGNRQFTAQKEELCSLLELSLVGAVLKSSQDLLLHQFVYLQFMGATQRVVCYGRVEKLVQLGEQKQIHVQFLQTSRSSLNQISYLVYDL